jgi:signal peptidase II
MTKNEAEPKYHRLIISVILIVTIGLDQLTKAVARDWLTPRPLSYIADMLRLQHVENQGAFLGLGGDLSPTLRFWIFTVGVAIFVAGAIWYLFKNPGLGRWTSIALTLIVAGGVGNLIDRAVKGTVTDFVNMGLGWLRTGIFNVADVALMVGVGMQFLVLFRTEKKANSR